MPACVLHSQGPPTVLREGERPLPWVPGRGLGVRFNVRRFTIRIRNLGRAPDTRAVRSLASSPSCVLLWLPVGCPLAAYIQTRLYAQKSPLGVRKHTRSSFTAMSNLKVIYRCNAVAMHRSALKHQRPTVPSKPPMRAVCCVVHAHEEKGKKIHSCAPGLFPHGPRPPLMPHVRHQCDQYRCTVSFLRPVLVALAPAYPPLIHLLLRRSSRGHKYQQ